MRSILVITRPSGWPLTLDEAKRHLRVDSDDEDRDIQDLIETATEFLDGPDGWLGRSLLSQTLELRLSRFGNWDVSLPCGPVSGITSVSYIDQGGASRALDPAVYRMSVDALALAHGQSWPAINECRDAISIRYVAGYGGVDDVPRAIRRAMLLHIGHLYANRSAVADGAPMELPQGYEALLAPYRLY